MRHNRFLNASLFGICTTIIGYPAPAEAKPANFSIQPMSLDAALRLYAIQSGDQIMIPAGLAAPIRSGGASGWLDRDEALGSILRGTGIEATRSSQGVVSFRKVTLNQVRPAAAFAPKAEIMGEPAPLPFQATAESSIDEGEIVVTAQRRAESQQRVPISVTVTSGLVLQTQAIRTLEDLSVRQANVRISQAPASDQIHIRGTGSGFGNGFEQSVATFVDGFYRNRSRSSRVALFDLDRVEILKGPQTTFFGANAIAGALNITTRKPRESFEANATVLYAPTDGEYNLEAGLGGPVSETLAVRVAGRWSGMDGYIKNDSGLEDAPHLNDKQARVSAVWNPTNALEISARFDIARLRDRGTFAGEILNCPPDGLPPGNLCGRTIGMIGPIDDKLDWHTGTLEAGYSNLNLEEGVVGATLDLGAVSLVSTTGYMHQKATVSTNLAPFPVLSPVGTKVGFGVIISERFKQFSQELRLQSSGDGPLNYMIGGYYEHGRLDLPQFIASFFARVGGAAAPTYGPNSLIGQQGLTEQKSKTWSGFGTLSYELVDRLTASVGLRYTTIRKTADRSFIFGLSQPDGQPEGFVPGPPAVQGPLSSALGSSLAPFPTGVRRDDKFMPSANLRYQFTPDVMAYASYSKGFKAGGFAGSSPDVFGPETVDAYEVGLKSTWLDRRVTTGIALYRSDFSNLQEAQNTSTSTGSPIIVVGNSAASRSQGVEFNTAWRVTPDLSFRIDAAYTDSKYLRYPNAPCSPIEAIGVVGCVKDRSGTRRAFAPEWSGSFGVDYATPLSPNAELRLGGLLYFTSAYFQQPVTDSLMRQSGYAKLDLRAAVGPQDRRWEVAVIGKNITDKATAFYRSYTPASIGLVVAIPDRPLSVAIQVSFKR